MIVIELLTLTTLLPASEMTFIRRTYLSMQLLEPVQLAVPISAFFAKHSLLEKLWERTEKQIIVKFYVGF